MGRAYQFRAALSRVTAARAAEQLAICAELYNAALQERRDHWRQRGVSVSYSHQRRQLPAVKAIRPDVAALSSQVLQDVLHRVDLAWRAFLRRVNAGDPTDFPRFKSPRRYESLTFRHASGWTLGPRSPSGNTRTITVQGIGTLRLRWTRELHGRVQTVTLKRDRWDHWWVVFSCDDVRASARACA